MKPTYSLDEIQCLSADIDQVVITDRARQEALDEFNFQPEDVCEVIQTLQSFDFHSTDTSKLKGIPFDVYVKRIYAEPYRKHVNAYIKLRVKGKLLIISFHTTV